MRRTFFRTTSMRRVKPRGRRLPLTASLVLAAATLALFSGVTQFLPIGRLVNGDQTLLVLNDETGQAAVACPNGVLKIVMTEEAPIYPEPANTSPTIGMAEAGHVICATEIRNGWWRISLPTAGGGTGTGWVSPETFAPVTINLEGGLAGGSGVPENAATVESVNAVLEMVKTVQESQQQMLQILKDSQVQLQVAEQKAAEAQKKLEAIQGEVQVANKRVDFLERVLTIALIASGVLLLLGLLGGLVRLLMGSGGHKTTKTQTRYGAQRA